MMSMICLRMKVEVVDVVCRSRHTLVNDRQNENEDSVTLRSFGCAKGIVYASNDR